MVITPLESAAAEKPLFLSARQNPKLTQLAKRRASDLSQKWNLWCQPIEFKTDAIRPASWIIQHHPALRTRADFRGDLKALILAALRHDPSVGKKRIKAR